MDYYNGNMGDMPDMNGMGMNEIASNTSDTRTNPVWSNEMNPNDFKGTYVNAANPYLAGGGYLPETMAGMAMQGGMQDPPAGVSPEMQEFLAEGYLMGPNCFGSESVKYADQLVTYINSEYHDYLYYTALARRAPNARGRALFKSIAADEMKHARKWASAYFLITGKRYFPTRRTMGSISVNPDFNTALRERYMEESKDALKYRMFAQTSTDRCLTRMALEASDDERQHAQDILALIQSM